VAAESLGQSADWRSQVVQFAVSTKYEINRAPFAMKLADGSIVVPELELVPTEGVIFPFKFTGFSSTDIHFDNDGVPKETRFAALLMRSSKPIVFSKITTSRTCWKIVDWSSLTIS